MDKLVKIPFRVVRDLPKMAVLGAQLGTREVHNLMQDHVYDRAGAAGRANLTADERTYGSDAFRALANQDAMRRVFYRYRTKEQMKAIRESWNPFSGQNKPLDTFNPNEVVTRLRPRTMNYFRQEVEFRSRSIDKIIAKRFAQIRNGEIAQVDARENAFGYGGKDKPQKDAVDLSYLQALYNLDKPTVGAPEVHVGGLAKVPAPGGGGVNGPECARAFLQKEMFQMVAGFSNLVNQMDLSTRKMYTWTYMSIEYTKEHINHMIDPDHKDTFAILSDAYRDKANNEGAETEPTELNGRRPEGGPGDLLSAFLGWS